MSLARPHNLLFLFCSVRLLVFLACRFFLALLTAQAQFFLGNQGVGSAGSTPNRGSEELLRVLSLVASLPLCFLFYFRSVFVIEKETAF